MSDDVVTEIAELPPPVDTVQVPSCFSPSNFGDLLQCPLSVLHGLGNHELLPPHPRAILGTLIHKVMDRVQRMSPNSTEIAIEMAATIFTELLSAEERRLNTDLATRELVPLRRAVGRTAWWNSLAYLKSWAAAMTIQRRGDQAFHTLGYRYTRSATKIPKAKTDTVQLGSERPLVVPELRLSGRPDYLERELDGTIHVTDFKTGSVLDRQGRPNDRYALQVRLYALMLEQIEPNAKLRLWLEGAQRIEVPWDDTIRAAVSEILEETTAVLPQEKKVAAETIASTGPQCWKCRIRHRCPLYLREAPDWWVRTSVARPVAPFDVWGQVLETNLNGGGAAALEIRDAAGRRVCLRGLESRIGGNSHSGSEVWFFNLEPSENLPAHGLYAHPRNYHGTAPSRAWPDALRLKIYVGQS
jgi:RecB family exonuclease